MCLDISWHQILKGQNYIECVKSAFTVCFKTLFFLKAEKNMVSEIMIK